MKRSLRTAAWLSLAAALTARAQPAAEPPGGAWLSAAETRAPTSAIRAPSNEHRTGAIGLAPGATLTRSAEASPAVASAGAVEPALVMAAMSGGETDSIADLAATLGPEPFDLYLFVRNEIAFEPYFGLRKGPQRTLIDRRGNDADQAALLVALLRAAGHDARFVAYSATVPAVGEDGYDLGAWLGMTNDVMQAAALLHNAGYAVGDETPGVGLTMWHVCAYLPASGMALDPSFKPSTFHDAMNVGAWLGYSRSALYAAAGGTATADYVQGLNSTNVAARLDGYAVALRDALDANFPDAAADEILGGRETVPEPLGTTTVEPFRLPGVNAQVYTELPETDYETGIEVTHGAWTNRFSLPDIAHRNLRITYTNTVGSAYPRAQLRLDDDLLAEEPGSFATNAAALALTVYLPEARYVEGAPAFQTATNRQTYALLRSTNHVYAIFLGLGHDENGRMRDRAFEELEALSASGAADTDPRMTGAGLQALGHAWVQAAERYDRLAARLAGSRAISFFNIGIAAQAGGYYVDAKNRYSIGLGSANSLATAWMDSALEHGALEQTQGRDRPAASTVKVMCKTLENGNKIFRATSNNWASVSAQVQTYSNLPELAALANQGFTLILPQSGAVAMTPGTWVGSAHAFYGPAPGGYAVGMMIGGSYAGGYSYAVQPISQPKLQVYGSSMLAVPLQKPRLVSYDPVDLHTGALTAERADLELSGGLPLAFARSYTTAAAHAKGPLGWGWTHDLDIRAVVHSDPLAALGGRRPRDACVALAAAAVLGDLAADDSPRAAALSALVSAWAMDRITEQAVSVRSGRRALTFLRMPDGAFSPPPGETSTLTATNGLYTLQERHGRTFSFGDRRRVLSIVEPGGPFTSFAYDAATTNLVSVTNSFGMKLSLTWSNSVIRTARDGQGRLAGYEYDAQSRLVAHVDPAGERWTFAYDDDNRLVSMTDPETRTLALNRYNAAGQVTNQVSATGQTWRYRCLGRESSETDPLGNTVRYRFDRDGRPVEVLRPALGRQTTAYDGRGHAIATVSPAGVTDLVAFDSRDNPVRTLEAAGSAFERATSYAYDAFDRLSAVTNALGGVASIEYDAAHRPIRRVDPLGTETLLAYDARGLCTNTAVRSAAGELLTQTSRTFDAAGREWIVQPPAAGASTNTYTVAGDLTQVRDALGRSTRFYYDARRLPTNVVNAANGTTRRTYYRNGLLKTETDPLNHAATNLWTAADRPLAVFFPDGSSVSNVYDAADRLVGQRDPRGAWSAFALDAAGRVVTNATAFSLSATAYDAAGRPALRRERLVAAHWAQWQTGFDALDRPLVEIDPVGAPDFAAYDALDRAVATTNALGRAHRVEYDALGRPVSRTRPSGARETFGYDALSRLTAFTNAEGRAWGFAYDQAGRLLSATNAAGETTRFRYDAAGRMDRRWDSGNRETAYAYDALDRRTAATYPGGLTCAWTNDAAGRLTGARRAAVTETFAWDSVDSPTQAVTRVGALSWTVQLRRDAAGNVTNVVYPGGVAVAYEFDADGRPARLVDWTARASSFGWFDCGWLGATTNANGTLFAPTADYLGRWTAYTHGRADGPFASAELDRDALGRLVSRRVNAGLAPPAPAWRRVEWTHDAADRPVAGTLFEGTEAAGTAAYAWDAAGALVSASTTTGGVTRARGFGWDGDGRLGSYTNAAGQVRTYAYTASGALAGRFADGAQTWYALHPGTSLPLADLNAAGAVARRYIWGPGGLIAHVEASGQTRWYHADERGSTVALTDETGQVTDRFVYNAHGELLARTGTTQTPFLFLGAAGVRSEGEGLYLMGARWYDAELRRFLSPDPLGLDGGANLYAYADGDPVNRADPLGLCAGSVGSVRSSWERREALANAVRTGFRALGAVALLAAPGPEEFLLGAALKVAGRAATAVARVSGAAADFARGAGLVRAARPAPILARPGAVPMATGVARVAKSGEVLALPPYRQAGGGLVIGRGAELNRPFTLAENEFRLSWPATSTTRSEWKINSGLLRQEMRKGNPIRDASPGDVGGMYLNAERNLLESRGWQYNSATGYWHPPGS